MSASALLSLKKMTIFPVDHHGDYKISRIVFMLGENFAKNKDLPYG
jgi:hypothetical protein